ncbi:MAG: hypothetical protein WBA68_11670 [Alteraurantiacibacter sp.]
MLRKIGLLIGVAACGALVTSCGDDETPTPTPTSTDTATPTPTPTTAVSFDLSGDFITQSTNANYIAAFFTPDGSITESFNSGGRINGTSAIELVSSPDSTRFAFPDLSTPANFGADDFVSVSATTRSYVRGGESLDFFLPYGEVLRVTYEIDKQDFTRDTVAGTLRSVRTAFFLNPVTTTADITATLTYTGSVQVLGGEPGVSTPGTFSSPDTTVTVTPGNPDDVGATIRIFSNAGGTSTLVTSFTIDDELSNSVSFGGEIAANAQGFSGSYGGALAGANREELVLNFALVHATDGRRFVGSFIGQR